MRDILVTGATGHIGSRLVPRLLAVGHRVRVLVRDPLRFADAPWMPDVSVAFGDVRDPDALGRALEGMDAAYYLVHSMAAGRGYAELDRQAAYTFAAVARNLSRVVYLGGILPREPVTGHLASRAEVGEILRTALPTMEMRAGPVIGPGSTAFQMVKGLADRLPIMITPMWVENRVQPIATRDLLAYLLRAMETDATGVVDVGTEPLTFAQMMQQYAAVRGLSARVMIPVPFLAPKLAAQWVGLVTPVSNRYAVPLIDSMRYPVVGDVRRARELFPEIHPMLYAEAVAMAIRGVEVAPGLPRSTSRSTDRPHGPQALPPGP